jgi:hypothetical protein
LFQFSLPILKIILKKGARNFGLFITTIFIKTPPSTANASANSARRKNKKHYKNEKRKKFYKKSDKKSCREKDDRVLKICFPPFHKNASFFGFV